jgi:CheY-like chemotaxis protein
MILPFYVEPHRDANVMADQATILVIDDDTVVREALTQLFRKKGYRVMTAKDGVEGLKLFWKHVPDITLIDIIMPEQDGIGAILEMHRGRPGATIIAMSGASAGGEFLEAAGKLGAQATLRKPITWEAFRSALRSTQDTDSHG